MTRQDKTRQDKTRQDKTRQDKTRQEIDKKEIEYDYIQHELNQEIDLAKESGIEKLFLLYKQYIVYIIYRSLLFYTTKL